MKEIDKRYPPAPPPPRVPPRPTAVNINFPIYRSWDVCVRLWRCESFKLSSCTCFVPSIPQRVWIKINITKKATIATSESAKFWYVWSSCQRLTTWCVLVQIVLERPSPNRLMQCSKNTREDLSNRLWHLGASVDSWRGLWLGHCFSFGPLFPLWWKIIQAAT